MMPQQPLVSVGIPAYNRAEGLARTLACITGQTYQNLEIIVSDNCSPDPEVEKVAAAFAGRDHRIRYFRQSENKGAFFNFLFVLEKATGTYFMWAADDDEWDSGYIEPCVGELAGGHCCSAITSYHLKNRALHKISKTQIPLLSCAMKPYEQLKTFFERPVASLVYGVHKRSEMLFCQQRRSGFDYFDCYFAVRMILSGGFSTLPDKFLYTVGVDDPERPPKPYAEAPGRLYTYLPYYVNCAKVLATSAQLNVSEKIKALFLLTEMTAERFSCTEKKHRPFAARVASLGLKVLRAAKRRLLETQGCAATGASAGRVSYAQDGEDLIMDHIFTSLKIARPTYIDIGANHPTHFNNTYYFYQKGCTGINIEPNPELCNLLRTQRCSDINLNMGISDTSGQADFYVMSVPTMSTFSHAEAQRLEAEACKSGMRISKTIQVQTETIGTIVAQFCGGTFPDLLSLDVEGHELKILEGIDLEHNGPKVICVETITYSEDGQEKKVEEIIGKLTRSGYLLYADTYINSIFVKEALWRSR